MREHARLRRYVLREIERNGPLLSRDLKDDRRCEPSGTHGGERGRCG